MPHFHSCIPLTRPQKQAFVSIHFGFRQKTVEIRELLRPREGFRMPGQRQVALLGALLARNRPVETVDDLARRQAPEEIGRKLGGDEIALQFRPIRYLPLALGFPGALADFGNAAVITRFRRPPRLPMP